MADLDLDNAPQFLETLYNYGDIGKIWDEQPSLSHKIVAFSTFFFMVIIGYVLFFVKAFSSITIWAINWVGSLFGFEPYTEINTTFLTIFKFLINISFPFLLILSLGLGTMVYLIYDYWQPIQRTLRATWEGRPGARGYIPNIRARNVRFSGLKKGLAGIFNLVVGFFAGVINFFQDFHIQRVNIHRVPSYVWANTAGLMLAVWYFSRGRDLWHGNAEILFGRRHIAEGALQFGEFLAHLWAVLSLLRYGWFLVAAYVAIVRLFYSSGRAFLTLIAAIFIVVFDATVETFKARMSSVPWPFFGYPQDSFPDVPIIPSIILVLFIILGMFLLSEYHAEIWGFLQATYRALFGVREVNENIRAENIADFSRNVRIEDDVPESPLNIGSAGEILLEEFSDAPVVDDEPYFLPTNLADAEGTSRPWRIAWIRAIVYGIFTVATLGIVFTILRDIEPVLGSGSGVSSDSGYSIPFAKIPGFDIHPSTGVPVPKSQSKIGKGKSTKVKDHLSNELDGITTAIMNAGHPIIGRKPASPTDEFNLESGSIGKSKYKNKGAGTKLGTPALSGDSSVTEGSLDPDKRSQVGATKKEPYMKKEKSYTGGKAKLIKEKHAPHDVTQNGIDGWWVIGKIVQTMKWPFTSIVWPLLSSLLSYPLGFAKWLLGWMWRVLTTERNSHPTSSPACLSEPSGLVIFEVFAFGLSVFAINLFAIELKHAVPASVQIARLLSWLPIVVLATHLYASWTLETLAFYTGTPILEYWETNKYLFAFWLLCWLKIAKTTFTLISYLLYNRQPEAPFAPGIVPNDVTVVVPVCGRFPDIHIFRRWIASLLVKDFHYLLIAPDTLNNRNKVVQALSDFASHKFSILQANSKVASRRELVHDAFRHIDTRITCVTDMNVSWSEEFLKSALAAFENPIVTLVGTSRDPYRYNYGDELSWPNFWNYIACNNIRKFDVANTAAYNIDGGVALIPSSTWLARTDILEDIHYRENLLSEEWLGDKERYTAEDYYTTRYFTTNGHSVVWINNPDPSNRPYIVPAHDQSSQGIMYFYEAAKVHWRHIIYVLFLDATIWRRQTWSSFALFAAQFVDNGFILQLIIGTIYWCLDIKPVSWCVLVFLNVILNFFDREYSFNREALSMNGLLLRLTSITLWPLVDGLIDFWAMINTMAEIGVNGFEKVVGKVLS